MSVEKFIPELWSAKLLEKYLGALVFGQGTVANRDYEGEIKDKGDTVHINSIGDPGVRKYERGKELTFDELATSSQELLIDQADYFAFLVNDVDKVQAAGDFGGAALARAAYKLKATADSFAAGVLSKGARTENQLGRVKIVSGGTQLAGADQITAYDVLVELGLKLSLSDVPLEGRYVVVDPNFIAATQKDDRFAKVDASGSSETLRNGIVARAAGFDILVSNNLAKVGGTGAAKDDKIIVAGTPGAFTFADQILKTEAGRREKGFDDFVKGLNVYGAKVTIPEGLATASVQEYAPGTGATTVVVGS
ncbi:coat protein [Mycetocola tolaasinivorans]|uniref:Coat protein n=1 Tax=Mycetocola tolaasinivorans TaxID=76635 RepID=A0A3L7A824_9MICO|nr:coat protein [Mycetocola tolaasinivorans]RLP76327.1 coat protein [Mycetocola tolaasinivorans]